MPILLQTMLMLIITDSTPPSYSTHGYVPVISDALMEKCIETYNQAKWLGNSL